MEKNIYISALANKSLTEYLRQKGFALHLLNGSGSPVYSQVSTHADIHMCQLGLWEKSQLFPGNIKKLGRNYPGNIIYNAVCTGKYFIHNLRYTDPMLIEAAGLWHETGFPGQPFIKINVKQGYTRCCCLPVDDTSFITSDRGIARSLTEAGACVLTISEGNIDLPGFDYGFIGGCAGHLIIDGRRTVVFNGDLSSHPDYEKIAAFIKDRDIDLKFFDDHTLTDIGSILCG